MGHALRDGGVVLMMDRDVKALAIPEFLLGNPAVRRVRLTDDTRWGCYHFSVLFMQNARILSNRPMSVVTELTEVQTAWQDSEFITECLCWHNVYRQRHGSPVLSMSAELCEYAQTWANHLAHTNKFYYRNDREIGQNLYQRPVTTAQGDITGQEVSSYWYAAVRQYDYFKEPDVLHASVHAGHFTQLVWAATRHFGVGKARSRDGKIIVVAHYSPSGNISGGFEMNVLPPIPDQYNTGPYIEQDYYQPQQRRNNNTPSTSSSH